MTTFWQVLGIEPTTDRRRIQKAYAARLKQCHPEDEPERFQLIRLAYEEALESTGSPPHTLPTTTASRRQEEERRVSQAVDDLMDRVKALEKRGTVEAWSALLESEHLWNLVIQSAFQGALFEYLSSSRCELDDSVWTRLDERFHWKENARPFYRSLDPAAVDWVLERLHARAPLRTAPRAAPRSNESRYVPREMFTLLPDRWDAMEILFLLLLFGPPFLSMVVSLLIWLFG